MRDRSINPELAKNLDPGPHVSHSHPRPRSVGVFCGEGSPICSAIILCSLSLIVNLGVLEAKDDLNGTCCLDIGKAESLRQTTGGYRFLIFRPVSRKQLGRPRCLMALKFDPWQMT